MKWTESATKHWSTRTALKFSLHRTSILFGQHLYDMVRGTYIYEKSYNQDHIVLDVFLHLAIVWMHCTADQHTCSPQSDGCTAALHNCTHWTQCSLPSAEYSWVHTMLNCTMLNVTRLVHVTMLDVTEQFWPKIWSHFRCCYCSQLHRPDFQLY